MAKGQKNRQGIRGLLVSLLFVVAGILIFAKDDSSSAGWFIVAFFGTSAMVFAWEIMHVDEETRILAEYRRRFRNGPVGCWCTSLGGGFEMTHGCDCLLNADGSGTFYSWDGLAEDPSDLKRELAIEWRSVGPCQLEIRKCGEGNWELVSYDFLLRRNEYNLVEVCIFQPDHSQLKINKEAGFWWSPYPLVHREDVIVPAEKPHEIRR